MRQHDGLTPEERDRLIEIQDSLIDRYYERGEALDRDDAVRAMEIEQEIKQLQREKEKIQGLATTLSS